MTLYLNKKGKYAYPYFTNRNYLRNLTELQMIPLEEMEWNKGYKYIDTSLWEFPWITYSKSAKKITEAFIKRLNEDIMGL